MGEMGQTFLMEEFQLTHVEEIKEIENSALERTPH